MFYLLLAVVVLQIAVLVIGDYIKRLRNNGRKSNQSEEAYHKQIKRWSKVQNTLQGEALLLLILYLLYEKGMI